MHNILGVYVFMIFMGSFTIKASAYWNMNIIFLRGRCKKSDFIFISEFVKVITKND